MGNNIFSSVQKEADIASRPQQFHFGTEAVTAAE
jgi:hypothetical protein